MEYLLSMSLKEFSFRNEMTKFILETFKVKSIEYNKDFEWFRINKKDVFEVETDQIQFNLTEEVQLVLQNMNNSLPRIYGGKIDFDKVNLISKKVEKEFTDFIVCGRIHNYLDSGLQNTDELKYWKLFERTIPSYAQIIPNPKYSEGPGSDMIPKEFISIESLPGHSHQMGYDEKLWFGSCWQMYFSPVYYKYIPKFLFDNFTDCYENNVFENGLRRITLYKNIEEYDLPESRAKQWAFRRAVGIDSIAHELTKESNRIEPENLPVKITKQNCVKGTTRVELHYKDRIEIKEFLDDGITMVYEEIK